MGNTSGAGVYGGTNNQTKSFGLGRLCTVFQAEVYAILKCWRSILLMGLINENITLYSDSQAALKALQAVKVTSKLVLECIYSLQDLSSNNSVTLVSGYLDTAALRATNLRIKLLDRVQICVCLVLN